MQLVQFEFLDSCIGILDGQTDHTRCCGRVLGRSQGGRLSQGGLREHLRPGNESLPRVLHNVGNVEI